MAPTFVAEYESVWDGSDSSKSVDVTVAVGDVLIVYSVTQDNNRTVGDPSGSGLTFTLIDNITTASYCDVRMWKCTSATSGTIAVSCTPAGTSGYRWGFNVLRFSGASGTGASAKTNTSGNPSLSITTEAANSAIVWVCGDWNGVDGSSRAYREADAGTFTEQTYYRSAGDITAYGGYHADASTAAAKTVGLTTPSQKYAIIAVEVKGSSGTDATVTPSTVAAVAAVPSATPSAGSTVTPATVAALAAVPSPTLSTGVTLAPATVAAVADVPAATASAGSTVTPSTVAGAAAVPAPTLQLSALVQAQTVAAVASVLAPAVSDATVNAASTATVTAGRTSSGAVTARSSAAPTVSAAATSTSTVSDG